MQRSPMPGDTHPGFTTEIEARNAQLAYEDMLIDRYTKGEPMSLLDQREAKRLIKARYGK